MIDVLQPHRWVYRNPNATLAIALALSLLLHIAALWKMPQVRTPSSELGERSGPLIVQLAPPPEPPSPPPREARRAERPPPAQTAPRPRVAEPPRRQPRTAQPARPDPPVIVQEQAKRTMPSTPSKTPSAAAPASPPPVSGDLAAHVEARRRARGESAPAPASPGIAPAAPAEDENARANRIAAANLGAFAKPGPGFKPAIGGIFDMRRRSYDYAEFVFYGWDKEIRRENARLVEVRLDNHGDIRIAIVRRMIAIIRENTEGDFEWESRRLNRTVTLSARARDNAGLEEFLIKDVFGGPRSPAAPG